MHLQLSAADNHRRGQAANRYYKGTSIRAQCKTKSLLFAPSTPPTANNSTQESPPFFENSDAPVPLIVKTENMQLNLPGFDIKIGRTKARPTVFDILRRKYVALTPEEWVRQHFVHYLIETKGYPATLLANEVKLSIGAKVLRADSVLYTTALTPRMIIEYKAPHIKISQHTFDQIFAYNLLLRAQYLVISNGLHHYCCKYDESLQKYLFLEEIPNYENL